MRLYSAGSIQLSSLKTNPLWRKRAERYSSSRAWIMRFLHLVTGDAKTKRRATPGRGRERQTKILKVGHHGSRYASSEKFLRQGGFEAAIISDGAENRYGHPSQDTLDRFRRSGLKLYRTDLEGEITIISRGRGYEIRTERTASGDLWAGRTPRGSDEDAAESPRQSRRAAGSR